MAWSAAWLSMTISATARRFRNGGVAASRHQADGNHNHERSKTGVGRFGEHIEYKKVKVSPEMFPQQQKGALEDAGHH